MSLTERINQDVKQAMKARDKETLKVLRMLKSALQMEQLEHSEPLNEEQEITIISRELKQRKDSLAEFEKAGRQDLVDEVTDEIVVVERYLPKQLSEEEIEVEVRKVMDELNATSKSDFGKVMGKAMANLKGKADGNLVKEVTKNLLG
ncbi:MAG: GatB/YqeY domain-containing protein [Ruoffia tabacinasalis]|uniref:GatB/YqeY domain-containing protein n=1 Tax=unclassified Ruoffia TaxID=2862149 RepID=UPI000ED0F649|nr:aspartyl-tRNA amidotransferase [Aerococcaceae bacterium]